MKSNIQYTVARGAMQILANAGQAGFLALVGISKDDYDMLSGKAPWPGTARNRVMQTLKSLLFLTTDSLGLNRFRLPAEWVAGGIAMFCSPVNIHSACHLMANTPSASDLASGRQQIDECTPEQIFATCVQLIADPKTSEAQALFQTKTGLAIAHTIEEEAEQ